VPYKDNIQQAYQCYIEPFNFKSALEAGQTIIAHLFKRDAKFAQTKRTTMAKMRTLESRGTNLY
jgi:hypothetical protein